MLYAHGGVAGGHSLYVKDKKLRYTFNWVGTKLLRHRRRRRDHAAAGTCSPPSSRSKGQNTDPAMPGFAGTLTLYVDDEKVGEGEIVTQPGPLLPRRRRHLRRARQRVARHARVHARRSAFTGGTIDKVVVDVSGEKFVDHEAQVAAWFSRD